MKKIEVYAGANLDEAVEMLLRMKEQGESVYCNFNGHKLYSDNVTIDSAYLEVCGKTKAEWDKEMKERLENYKKEEEHAKKVAIEKIPSWIEQGKKYIYPQKLNEWKRCVKARANDLYHGYELDSALEVMEALSNGMSFEEANQIIENQGHSGMSHSIVMGILINFCKNGPEFYESTEANISAETKQYINKQKKLNLRYKKELNSERQA